MLKQPVIGTLILASTACGPGATPREPERIVTPSTAVVPGLADPSGRRLYYVPVYSHIYFQDTTSAVNLAVTLSVRNTDPQRSLKLRRVDYYDTRGRPLHAYVPATRVLGPLETAEFVVHRNDVAGGSGANFLVEVASDSTATDPVVEAVMIGFSGNVGTSFVTQARLLRRP